MTLADDIRAWTRANAKARHEYHAFPIAACLLDGCHNLTRTSHGYCCTDHLHASREDATP